jgi:hypothetical protein
MMADGLNSWSSQLPNAGEARRLIALARAKTFHVKKAETRYPPKVSFFTTPGAATVQRKVYLTREAL